MEENYYLDSETLKAFIYSNGYNLTSFAQKIGITRRTLIEHLDEAKPFRSTETNKSIFAVFFPKGDDGSLEHHELEEALITEKMPSDTRRVMPRTFLTFIIEDSHKSRADIAKEAGIEPYELENLEFRGALRESESVKACKVYRAITGKNPSPSLYKLSFMTDIRAIEKPHEGGRI